MRVPLAALLALLTLSPAHAQPACGGRDLMAAFAAERPWAHAVSQARAAAVENGRGRLWRVERAGQPASWLLGTMHTVEAADRAITPRIRGLLAGARVLAVEISDAQMALAAAEWQSDPARSGANPAFPQPFEFSPAGRAALSRFADRRGWEVGHLAGNTADSLFFTVTTPPCEEAALGMGRHYMDLALTKLARAYGLDVVGLDPEPRSWVYFDRIEPRLLWGFIEANLLAYDTIPEEDFFRTYTEAYLAGDNAAIDFAMLEVVEGAGLDTRLSAEFWPEFLRVIVTERNHLFMPRLLETLEGGDAIVAVGALHLPGPDGLVALLRNAGYNVTGVDTD